MSTPHLPTPTGGVRLRASQAPAPIRPETPL